MNHALRYARLSAIAALAAGAAWGLAQAPVPPVTALAGAASGPAGEPGPIEPAPDPIADEIAAALHRAALQPEAMAAAGLSTSDVALSIAAFKAAWKESSLPTDDAVHSEARRSFDALRRKVAAGLASAEEIAGVPAAAQQLALASTARATAVDALFQAAISPLAPASREVLTLVRENRAAWDQPWQYLATSLSQAERVQLREALANERIAFEAGETPDPEATALLQQIRARQEVAAAAASLEATLDAVAAAWHAAVLLAPPQE